MHDDGCRVEAQEAAVGFDGGLEQMFHMEVVSLSDNVMYSNVSREVPSFWATTLPPGKKVYIR